MYKNATDIVKQNNDTNTQKIEIKENITVDKAQQLYQKYITAMRILENK
nr:hypothetical protein DGKKSRWO_DGKKSRWO_CDS_0069 [uncultured phage]CAI9752233.1 hypothetical protein CVNMHQAP_CVNMHQAP_CDS_0069 [uncultured phage]